MEQIIFRSDDKSRTSEKNEILSEDEALLTDKEMYCLHHWVDGAEAKAFALQQDDGDLKRSLKSFMIEAESVRTRLSSPLSASKLPSQSQVSFEFS